MSMLMALLVGLLQGSLHCAGMCGPFVLSYGLALGPSRTAAAPATARAEGGATAALARVAGPALAAPPSSVGGRSPVAAGPRPQTGVLRLLLAHNAGRLTAFALLGAAFGALGSFVDAAARLSGLQAAAGFVGGSAMLLWAVDQLRTGHGGGGLERWSLWRIPAFGRRFRGLLGRRDPVGAYGCGFLLGLHPCGLLYAMLLAAAATGSPLSGAALLLSFGLGTVPALLAVAGAGAWGSVRPRGRGFTYATAGIVAASGVLFALRGMAVNGWVPNVWPWLF